MAHELYRSEGAVRWDSATGHEIVGRWRVILTHTKIVDRYATKEPRMVLIELLDCDTDEQDIDRLEELLPRFMREDEAIEKAVEWKKRLAGGDARRRLADYWHKTREVKAES